ncbi:hypothetical protein HY496_03330 [Candidatus Woesearchaeota archaeon]|nr:hypothetical protein [Candidatus Woesearchaeota archaeon]
MGVKNESNFDYQRAGVNLQQGDEASQILYTAAKQTWINRSGQLGEVVEIFEDFSGLRAIHIGGLPQGTYMNINFDGVGTKVEIAERVTKHDTTAYDLFAMVCDDAVARGAEPVIIGSILDVNSLGSSNQSRIDFINQLASGYVAAAREANVAIVNGEVAEVGARVQGYGPFNYNWGAGVVWFAQQKRMISGRGIKEGDTIVGLEEQGFRSNGLSLVREILHTTRGEGWHQEPYGNSTLGEIVLTPSRIYTRAAVEMTGGFNKEPKATVHGIAHITGGGIPGKLGRLLKPSSLGAHLDDLFEPCEMMKHCQEQGNVTDREAYRTWNMGQGMLLVTPKPEEIMHIAQNHGIQSKVVGEITEKPEIVIRSKGIHHEQDLVF